MLLGAASVLGSRLRVGVGTGPRGLGELPTTVEWHDGGHPSPNAESVVAAEVALRLAAAARTRDEQVLVLLSGGASALLAAPAEGISLDDKRATSEVLTLAGCPIQSVNCVRRHLSRIKGGQLALAAGRCLTLAISDVHHPEDSPCDIGSGPTMPDPTTYTDALSVLRDCDGISGNVRAHLDRGAAGDLPETPKPGDPRLADSSWHVLANRRTAMLGAEHEARRLGYHVRVVGPATHGEAREAGRMFAELALATQPLAGAMCVIGSGETTVSVRGHGRGGRNQEFVLGAAEFLAGQADVLFASMGTDGIDGPTDAAGGVVTGATSGDARAMGRRVADVLARNDAYTLLAALDDLIEWGPTLTNVGDLHILLKMNR
jgi:glycerate 2-kinase